MKPLLAILITFSVYSCSSNKKPKKINTAPISKTPISGDKGSPPEKGPAIDPTAQDAASKAKLIGHWIGSPELFSTLTGERFRIEPHITITSSTFTINIHCLDKDQDETLAKVSLVSDLEITERKIIVNHSDKLEDQESFTLPQGGDGVCKIKHKEADSSQLSFNYDPTTDRLTLSLLDGSGKTVVLKRNQ